MKLNRNDDSAHLYFMLNIKRTSFSISLLSTLPAVGFCGYFFSDKGNSIGILPIAFITFYIKCYQITFLHLTEKLYEAFTLLF